MNTLRLPDGSVVLKGEHGRFEGFIFRERVPIVRELHQINMKPTMLSAAIAVALHYG